MDSGHNISNRAGDQVSFDPSFAQVYYQFYTLSS